MRKTVSSLVIALVLGWTGAVYAGDFQRGVEAYRAGDYATALREFQELASAGDASAQNNLGRMYDNGQGVVQDYISAHMWFNIAAASGGKKAKENRDIVAKRMTPDQIAEAQKLAREWMEKHQAK